jgi:hypothetical protein
MAAKIILTIIGLIMIIQGVIFYFYSVPITQSMFPYASTEAVEVGAVMRKILAGGSIFIGIILFLARTNVASVAKRILFGASIGFSILLALMIHISLTNDTVNIPIAPLIVFAIFATISFVFGNIGIGNRRGY